MTNSTRKRWHGARNLRSQTHKMRVILIFCELRVWKISIWKEFASGLISLLVDKILLEKLCKLGLRYSLNHEGSVQGSFYGSVMTTIRIELTCSSLFISSRLLLFLYGSLHLFRVAKAGPNHAPHSCTAIMYPLNCSTTNSISMLISGAGEMTSSSFTPASAKVTSTEVTSKFFLSISSFKSSSSDLWDCSFSSRDWEITNKKLNLYNLDKNAQRK